MPTLPHGYEVAQDQDGDWLLIPPDDVIIFSVPGEPLLLAALNESDALVEASEYLAHIR